MTQSRLGSRGKRLSGFLFGCHSSEGNFLIDVSERNADVF